MNVKYKVDGMTCGGCVASLIRAMKAVEPSAVVEVSLEEGTMVLDESVPETLVAQAVDAAGFELRGRAS